MSLTEKSKQIGGVLVFQGLAFCITFVTNILIIRSLSKVEYATFTTCILMFGVVSVLSDSGITPTYRRLSGLYWNSMRIFSELVKSLFELRNKLLFTIIPVTLVIAFVLFYRQGQSIFNIFVLICLLAILLFLEIQKSIYIEILRSKLKVKSVQLTEAVLNISRLGFVFSIWYFINIEFVLIAYIVAGFVAVFFARSKAIVLYIKDVQAKPSHKKLMIAKYKELLPNSVFYIIQSQISLFLLFFFKGSEGVADFGALGRMTIVFNMLNAVVLNVFAAPYSREKNLHALRTKFVRLLLLLVLSSFIIWLLVFLLRHQIILILGNQYEGLENILLILTFNSGIAFILGSIHIINNAKAWVYYNARYAIPVSMASLLLGIFILDFNKIEHIIIYSLFPIVFSGLLKIADSLRGLKIAFK